jgi:uncharacterized protein
MNKTRRAVAQAAAAFSQAGFAVLQIDLQGCGDSQGEFETTQWPAWLADARLGLEWLRKTLPGKPVLGWGLRVGALLASALDAELNGQLWWQPTAQGKTALQQFLRMRLASEMGSATKTTMSTLKAALTAGEPIEVAGYTLGAQLAAGLEAAQLQAPSQPSLWLEASAQATLLPASSALLERWAAAHVQAQALNDPSPWAATELEDSPALTAASLAWLQQRF